MDAFHNHTLIYLAIAVPKLVSSLFDYLVFKYNGLHYLEVQLAGSLSSNVYIIWSGY